MARAATTSDVFNAVAEPSRRAVIGVLASGEQSVTEIVAGVGLTQPQVSKHLRVLGEVDLVRVRVSGRHHFYRLNGSGLRPIFDWVSGYERLWNERFDRLDDVLGELQQRERLTQKEQQ